MQIPRLKLWLFLVLISDFAGAGVVIPLLPFFAHSLGAEASTITLLIGLYPFAQAIGGLALGVWSQSFGRLSIIRASLAIASVSYMVMYSYESLVALFVGRVLGGFAGGKVGVVQALITDCTTEGERASHMGIVGAAAGIGMILGPIIGGIMAGSDPNHPDVLPVFAAASSLSIFGLVATFAWRPTLDTSRVTLKIDRKPSVDLATFLRSCMSAPRNMALAVTSLYGLCTSCMIAVIPLWVLARFGWGAREAGYIYAVAGFSMAVAQLTLVGWSSRRFGDYFSSAIGMALIAAATPLILMCNTLPAVLFTVGVSTFGAGVVFATSKSLISRSFPVGWAGVSMGANFALLSISQFFGAAGGGFLFSQISRSSPFWAIGAAALLASLLCVLMSLGIRSPAVSSSERIPVTKDP